MTCFIALWIIDFVLSDRLEVCLIKYFIIILPVKR